MLIRTYIGGRFERFHMLKSFLCGAITKSIREMEEQSLDEIAQVSLKVYACLHNL